MESELMETASTIGRDVINSYIKNYKAIYDIGQQIISELAKDDPMVMGGGYSLNNISEEWVYFRFINQTPNNLKQRIQTIIIPLAAFEDLEARAEFIHKSQVNSIRRLLARFRSTDMHDSEALRIAGNDLCDVITHYLGD